MKSKQAWLLVLVLLCQGRAAAQAEVKSDSNHVETGNPLGLHLRLPVNAGEPDTVNFEVWNPRLPMENIIAQTGWRSEGQFWVKDLSTLFFDADSLLLPPLPLLLRNGDTAYTNPLPLVVTATPSPDELVDLAPIKDIHREPTLWLDYWPWAAGVALILGILGLFFWLANRKPRSVFQSRAVQAPAHQIALKKLELLAQKRLIDRGLVKEYYAELTYILREYLEKRFQVSALESTSAEILEKLETTDFPDALSGELRLLLEQADLAKFAKAKLQEHFHEQAFSVVKKIVGATAAQPSHSGLPE